MTINSASPVMDCFRRLVSRGLSHDSAMEEATAFEVALTNATTAGSPDEIVRKKERVRKAAWRAKRPGQGPGPASTAISSSETITDRSPLEERDSRPSDVPDKPKVSSKGARIPDDWQPSVDDYVYGIDQVKLHRYEVTACAEEMRLWAQANANRAVARKADWGLTFKGWMRRAAPQIIRNRPRGGSNGQANSAGVGFAGRAAEARARIQERFGDPERPAPEDLQPVNGR